MPAYRRMLKNAVASTLSRLSVDRLAGRCNGSGRRPLIICYHRVVTDFAESAKYSMPSLLVSTAMFEKQLDWLAARYRLVSLDEALNADSGNISDQADQKQMASISFDDGYADFYWNAFPILKRRGIPSSLFVVSNLVGTPLLQTHDELYLVVLLWMTHRYPLDTRSGNDLAIKLIRLLTQMSRKSDALAATRYILSAFSAAEVTQIIVLFRAVVTIPAGTLKELQSVSWSMVKALSVQGVTIGSHTLSHSLLPHHHSDVVSQELLQSRLALEAGLGVPVKYLAYPDGQFNERVAFASEQAGYQYALTICRHQSRKRPAYSIPRIVLWERSATDLQDRFSPEVLGCLVNGVFDYPSRCKQDHSVS